MTIFYKWIAPGLVLLLVMLGYQLLIAPVIGEWQDDMRFLRAARIQAVRQAQQQSQPQK